MADEPAARCRRRRRSRRSGMHGAHQFPAHATGSAHHGNLHVACRGGHGGSRLESIARRYNNLTRKTKPCDTVRRVAGLDLVRPFGLLRFRCGAALDGFDDQALGLVDVAPAGRS